MAEQQHKEFFVQYSIQKAREAVKESEFNLANDYLNVAESRLYYALFYAVTALAYSEEYTTSKHYKLLGWFNKEFVYNRKIFAPEMFNLYQKAFENRMKSDYEISYKPVREKIEDNLARATGFIDEIEKYINKKQNLMIKPL